MPELPNIVRERLKVSRPTADHPDADALTAFAERALPESERAVVAEHVARCHDCRDILVLASPSEVVLVPIRVPLPDHGGWLRAPALRWGVVAAGFAVLMVTGLLQYQRRHEVQTFVAARQTKTVALEERSAQASGDELAKPAPGAPSALAGSANAAPVSANRVNGSANSHSASDGSTNERAAEPLLPRNEAAAPSASLALNSRNLAPALPFHRRASGRAASGASVDGPIKQSAPLYGGAAPSPAGGAGAQSQLVAENTADKASNQPSQNEWKDQKNEQGQPRGVAGRAFMDVTVDKAKAPQTTTVEVSAEAPVLETATAAPALSPSLGASWGISATGGLLRSFDQGRTWTNVDVNATFPVASQMVVVPQAQKNQQAAQQAAQQATQLPAPNQAQGQAQARTFGKIQAVNGQRAGASAGSIPFFRALSAAGLEIWAGGSAGVLYHSVNGGEQWARVFPSASGILLTGDIIGIAFSDPQHGQITTSAQELWTTSDAGKTWQKQ